MTRVAAVSVGAVVAGLERLAPPGLAEPWDEVGLRWGDVAAPARGVLLAIDLSAAVLAEAQARAADVVVAYHPPLWRAERGQPVAPLAHEAIGHGIAVFSPHTAWDAAAGGTNDHLADILELAGRRPLRPHRQPADLVLTFFSPPAAVGEICRALAACGCGEVGAYTHCSFRGVGEGTFLPGGDAHPSVGRVGELSQVAELRVEVQVPPTRRVAAARALVARHPYEAPAFYFTEVAAAGPTAVGAGRVGDTDATFAELIARIKARLGLRHLLLSLPPGVTLADRPGRAAVAAGAAGELWRDALAAGARLMVTGEVRHHDARAAAARGLAHLATLHSHSERGSLGGLAARLRLDPALAGLPISISAADCEPQQFV